MRAELFRLAAVLLTYPDDELLRADRELRAAATAVEPAGVRAKLLTFLDWLRSVPAITAQRHYVETFDLRRRSGLYLTYYLHGDTRKRGMALLVLKQRYRAHGLVLADGELPDLLPVVLEFAALAGPGDGEAPLRQHRQGVELLHSALAECGSPYANVVGAVVDVLPQLTDQDRAAIQALAFDGPPDLETVGLGPDLSPYSSCTVPEVSR